MRCTPTFALVLSIAGCAGPLPPQPDQGVEKTARPAAVAENRTAAPITTGALIVTGAETGDAAPTEGAVGSAAVPNQIVGFRASSVILYRSDTGWEGQRLLSRALPLPLHVTRRSQSSDRVEIMTVDGPRWIAPQEVTFAH